MAASAEWVLEHRELRSALKARVQRSVGAGAAHTAEYVVNALMEWPDGQDLVRRIARHLDDLGKGSEPSDGRATHRAEGVDQ